MIREVSESLPGARFLEAMDAADYSPRRLGPQTPAARYDYSAQRLAADPAAVHVPQRLGSSELPARRGV